jgi:hypothetical protein
MRTGIPDGKDFIANASDTDGNAIYLNAFWLTWYEIREIKSCHAIVTFESS